VHCLSWLHQNQKFKNLPEKNLKLNYFCILGLRRFSNPVYYPRLQPGGQGASKLRGFSPKDGERLTIARQKLKPASPKIALVLLLPAFRLKPVGAGRCFYPGLKPGVRQTEISYNHQKSEVNIRTSGQTTQAKEN